MSGRGSKVGTGLILALYSKQQCWDPGEEAGARQGLYFHCEQSAQELRGSLCLLWVQKWSHYV